jgi:hypothetical protein
MPMKKNDTLEATDDHQQIGQQNKVHQSGFPSVFRLKQSHTVTKEP